MLLPNPSGACKSSLDQPRVGRENQPPPTKVQCGTLECRTREVIFF